MRQWQFRMPAGVRVVAQGPIVLLQFQEGREAEILETIANAYDFYATGKVAEPTAPHTPPPIPVSPQPATNPGLPLPNPDGSLKRSPAIAAPLAHLPGGGRPLPQPPIAPPPAIHPSGSGAVPALTMPAPPAQGINTASAAPPLQRKMPPSQAYPVNVKAVRPHRGPVPDNGIKLETLPNGQTRAVVTGPTEVLPQPEIAPPPPIPIVREALPVAHSEEVQGEVTKTES